MTKKIKTKTDLILRKKAMPVTNPISVEIKKIIATMADAMFAEPDGIGIAAPQIGESLQLFLVADDVLRPAALEERTSRKGRKHPKTFLTFINPTLKKTSSKKEKDLEGCLSVRGEYGEVARPEKVSIEYFDETGTKKIRGASGLFARVIQHELDHLNGILFIDKAKNITRETWNTKQK